MAAVHVSLGGRDSARRVEEAEEAVKELRAALMNAGIAPPSLRPDTASLGRKAPCPAVERDGCRVGLAARLVVALRPLRATEVG